MTVLRPLVPAVSRCAVRAVRCGGRKAAVPASGGAVCDCRFSVGFMRSFGVLSVFSGVEDSVLCTAVKSVSVHIPFEVFLTCESCVRHCRHFFTAFSLPFPLCEGLSCDSLELTSLL